MDKLKSWGLLGLDENGTNKSREVPSNREGKMRS